MSLKDFVILQKIGEGSYSSVHKVRRISDNHEYALKKVKLAGLTEKEKDNSLNEVRILASIQHPNMIAYKEAFFDESTNSLCIIMELAENGDLAKKISIAKQKQAFFPEEEIWTIALHMIRGLKAMHQKKILHRDLKCANVFISKNDLYKLGDLNVSKVAKLGLVYTQTGTPYYASPEVWGDKPYDSQSDIWSLGCILYELAALNPPFRAKDMEGLYKKVMKGTFDRIPVKYSQDLQKFISLCLQVNSSQRPTVNQLIGNVLLKRNTEFLADTSQEQFDEYETHRSEDLLNTIRMPKNPRQLREKLPKPQYEKKVLENSFDGTQQKETNHQRISSVKLNRIQSVTSHKQKQQQQQSQQQRGNQLEEQDQVLPLIQKIPRQYEKYVSNGLYNSENYSNQKPTSQQINLQRYDNSTSIVSESRVYLERDLSSKRKHPTYNNNKQQNYNEDYSRLKELPITVNSPTISVVSRMDSNYQQNNGNQMPEISQPQIKLRSRIASFSPPINYINNSNAKVPNQYQKVQSPYLAPTQHEKDHQYARPSWWG